MAGAGVPVPSVDDGAIVVAPQACFKVESHENGVVIHLQRGGPRRSWGLRGLEEMQGPLRGGAQTTTWPRRGAATRHRYGVPVQSLFMKPSKQSTHTVSINIVRVPHYLPLKRSLASSRRRSCALARA